MKPKVVAILETRTGEHLADLIARRGGRPLHAPALEEVPAVDTEALVSLIDRWKVAPFSLVVFQTGVGTRALFNACEELRIERDLKLLLADAVVIVRGPKPTGELNARGIRIDLRAASPFTTDDVLNSVTQLSLRGRSVLVQRYGATNRQLRTALEARGASVEELVTYRWGLPANLEPLYRLVTELTQHRVDAVVFTSAVQVQHLMEVATTLKLVEAVRSALNSSFVASIGPVCSRALIEQGIAIGFEASPPKLGPLVNGLDAALS